MNFDALLKNDRQVLTEQYVSALRITFRLCGSRKVLTHEKLNPDTDWDFYASQSDSIENLLEVMGFHKKFIPEDYTDITTDSVWIVLDAKGEPLPIQVVLKKPEYIDILERFWNIMRERPETYKKLFWKSYVDANGNSPNTQDTVRVNINHWMEFVMPLL